MGDSTPALTLDDLAATHPGITEELGNVFAQAAKVCLDRHHTPPVVFIISEDQLQDSALLSWDPATTRARAAWGDQNDTIESGAVGVTLAYLGGARDLVAIRSAQRWSGADYYVSPSQSTGEDFEGAIRLEISGIDRGGIPAVRRRLADKLEQLRRGNAFTPGIAVVVGFGARALHLATLDP